MLRPDTVTVGLRSDVLQDISQLFSSWIPGDEEQRTAGGAEQLLSLQSQQVWEVLLGVMIHQHQAKSLNSLFISLNHRAQCRDGLS